MSRPSYLHRRLLLTMLWVVDHPKKVLASAAIALFTCIALALTNLGLSTNQDELFSSDVKFFHDYINFTQDFPENQASYVIVEAIDPLHPPAVSNWTAIADAITDRLKKETDDVKAVDSHVPLEELGTQGILFEDPQQLKQDFNDFQQLSIPFRPTNFLNRSLGNSPLTRFFNALSSTRQTDQTRTFADLMATGMTGAILHPNAPLKLGQQIPDLSTLAITDPSKLGYYYVEDQENPANHLLLVRVYERPKFSKQNGLADTLNNIRANVTAAAAPFKQFRVNLTGRPALEADEMATTDHDARTSEIAALSAVFFGLVIVMRSFWIAIVAEIALLIGIGLTFGWATVTVHKLNLLSMVFLIALTGIGMDYLIQVLTRYRRESARRTSARNIWVGVFKYVAAPINTACLGAAGAFFVSIFTNFRGAAELGVVASGGLLLCLLTCYLILPPLLTLFPAKSRHVDAERHSHHPPPLPKTTSRWRHLWLAPPFVWAVLLLLGIPFARRAVFNPSLLKMQAQSLPSVQLIHKLQTWSAAVLVPQTDTEKLRQVQDAVHNLPTVASTESILTAYDNRHWLEQQQVAPIPPPGYDPVLPESLPALIKAIAKLPTTPALSSLSRAISHTDPNLAAAQLTAWQNIFIQQLIDLLAPFQPPPLNLSKIPASLRSHLIGADGQFVLYIYPKNDLWHQSALASFVHEVEASVAKLPNPPAVTGIAINVYHSTSSIEGSFYEATGYALALIFFLVLIDLKNFYQTLLAISVLVMGLPMLVALMGLFGIDWNFANFFGLPILIGAGHEYGVFMVHRYNEARIDPHRRWQAWDVSDKALLLCGYVTSVSFGFFWLLGHHEGLKSLGLVMALGTTSIYLATLCVLRPLLLWKLDRRSSTPPTVS